MPNSIVTQRPVVTLTPYAALDAVGGLLTFAPNCSSGAQIVELMRVEILDTANPADAPALELHLFTDPTLAVADNAPFVISDATFAAGTYLGVIACAVFAATTVGTQAGAQVSINEGLHRAIPLSNGAVYGQLVCTGTPTLHAVNQLIVAASFAPWRR